MSRGIRVGWQKSKYELDSRGKGAIVRFRQKNEKVMLHPAKSWRKKGGNSRKRAMSRDTGARNLYLKKIPHWQESQQDVYGKRNLRGPKNANGKIQRS